LIAASVTVTDGLNRTLDLPVIQEDSVEFRATVNSCVTACIAMRLHPHLRRLLMLTTLVAGALYPPSAMADRTSTEEARFGSWLAGFSIDPMSDEKSYVAVTVDGSGAALVLLCGPEGFQGVLTVKQSLRVERYGSVRYRLDDRAASILVGEYTKHGVSVIGDFVKEWSKGTHLLLRLGTFSYEQFDLSFPIDGIQDAIDYVKPHCVEKDYNKKKAPVAAAKGATKPRN
jgi:hypothetical protein